jgi:hypothetical protein
MPFYYFGHYGQTQANALNRFICLTPPKGRKNPFIVSFSYASTVVAYGKSVEYFRFFIANSDLAFVAPPIDLEYIRASSNIFEGPFSVCFWVDELHQL